jgi:DNA-binding NtrC family response regulator
MHAPSEQNRVDRDAIPSAGSSGLGTDWIIGQSLSMRRVAQHAYRAAEVGCTVLISGETGTGKEVWARALHRSGPRAAQPFVPVNCAALTTTLAESQLFGHEWERCHWNSSPSFCESYSSAR